MRKLFIIAALGLFAGATVLPTQDAYAGKKEEDAGGEAEALDIIMEETGSAKLDGVFKRAETPIETLDTVRADVRSVNTELVKSLGLKEGTPFKDALADLQEKAEGKINVSFEDNKMPTFKAEEGVPDNVQASIDGLNTSFGKLTSAEDKLGKSAEELMSVSTDAADLISAPKELGLKATQVPKAVSKGNKNVKNLKAGVTVTKDLVTELATLTSDVKATFTK